MSSNEDSTLRQVSRKVLGGYFGGLCMGAVAHPFDTIKTRVQTGVFPSIGSCIKDTLKNEGPLAFYKGVVPPVATCGIYNATMFSFNEFFKSLIMKWTNFKTGDPVPLWLVAAAAIATAPFACLVFVPAEVVKVRLQLQRQGKGNGRVPRRDRLPG